MSTAVATRETAAVATSRQADALQRIASQVTPQKHIRTRKGRGGMVYKYVDGAYVIRTLNEGFIHDWDFEADNEQVIEFNGQPFEVRCRGRLTVRLEGRTITKVQYGSQAIEFIKDKQGNIIAPVSIGDCFKGAATDALKKCASMLGVALDLYDSDFKLSDLTEYPDESVEAEREPVRTVKFEGAQPTKPTTGELPTHLKGQAGQVVALARALKYTDADLGEFIHEQFRTVVMPGMLGETIEYMTGDEHRELIRVLKGKLGGK